VRRLARLLRRGLEVTAQHWPALRAAYALVHQAAQLLANEDAADRATVETRYAAHLTRIREARDQLGLLAPAIDRFLRVSASYWPGLFHCYAVPALPRTNNELEHFFGAARYHERRAAGRKGADPGTVVRGQVRLVAAVATRQRPRVAHDLLPVDLSRWQELRRQLTVRHDARRAQRRFRHDPATYLRALEDQLLKDLVWVLLVPQSAAGTLPGDLGPPQVAAQPVDAQADAVLLGHPGGELGRCPGALARRHRGPHPRQQGRGQGGVLAAAWLIRQGVKPAGKEGFAPGAHGLLVLAAVARDARHAPARIREAHHLQAVTRARRARALARARPQFNALLSREGDTVQI
jgi:hypothetical protein